MSILITLITYGLRLSKHMITLSSMSIYIYILLLYTYVSRLSRRSSKEYVRVFCKFEDGQPLKNLITFKRYLIIFNVEKRLIKYTRKTKAQRI